MFNFKDDIRNLNNTVQYRSASAKALHIENDETDSNYFGHLPGMRGVVFQICMMLFSKQLS